MERDKWGNYTYMGHYIKHCQQLDIGSCHGKGWHIQTYHSPTGIPWAEEYCPLYHSLAAARAAIREDEAIEDRVREMALYTD